MQKRRTHWLSAAFVLLAMAAATASTSFAEVLKVTSTPSGAKVEIDGVLVGITPYQIDYPAGYFHKPHTVFSSRLERAMVIRIYKEGYAPQETTITEGPFDWTDLKGRSHGRYWLLKANEVQATLHPLAKAAGTEMRAGEIPAKNNNDAHSPPNATASAASENGVLTLTSESTGAEIYIDGEFVGETPATLSIGAGKHQITVKAKGRKDWTRDIEVMKGSQVTLNASPDVSP